MNLNILNLLKNINISSIASTTNKTLNVVKKSIPVYKELRPYFRKEKSLFKKEVDDEIKMSKPINNTYNDSLTFFQ